jgi:hypothetical protein
MEVPIAEDGCRTADDEEQEGQDCVDDAETAEASGVDRWMWDCLDGRKVDRTKTQGSGFLLGDDQR